MQHTHEHPISLFPACRMWRHVAANQDYPITRAATGCECLAPGSALPVYSAAGQGLTSVCSSPTATPLPHHHAMRRQVDLGDTFAVYKVVVYNRLTTGRLTYFEVRVGNSPATTSPIDNPVCATYTVPALSVYTFNCNPALVGRYIVVRLLTQCELFGASYPGRDGRLAICELQAFGVLTTPPAQNVPN